MLSVAVGAVDIPSWADRQAIALRTLEPGGDDRDLGFLKSVVGNARVVGFGEASHGSHEMLALRNRVFRYLVEHLGVTAIAAETDFALGTAIDDYVNGEGPLTRELVASVFSFSAPDAWEENRQLLEWMRDYNRRGSGPRLHFYGLEMQGHILQVERPNVSRAFRAALDFMEKVDAASAGRFRARVVPLYGAMEARSYAGAGSGTPYDELSSAQRDALTVAIADAVALFERRHVDWSERSSPLAYQRALRNVLNARALDADFRADGWWLDKQGDPDQRDATSAQNLQWVLQREGPRGRVFLFAHDVHISTARSACPNRFTSMGQNLKQELAESLVTIATVQPPEIEVAGGEAPCTFPDKLAAPLSRLGRSPFALDLRGSPFHRDAGFDALIFVREQTPARASSLGGAER